MSLKTIFQRSMRTNLYPIHNISQRTLSTTPHKLANINSSNVGEVISEVAKEEGGPYKGPFCHILPTFT